MLQVSLPVYTKPVNDFIEGQLGLLHCDFSTNQDNIMQIKWYQNDNEINAPSNVFEFDESGKTLLLKNLSSFVHDGAYKCELSLKNSQIVSSLNDFFLKLKSKYIY